MKLLRIFSIVSILVIIQPVGGICGRFLEASPDREILFPRDHGKHPGFETEWFYFTGHLESKEDKDWGFQVTFFRRTMFMDPPEKESAWVVRDLYPAHFAISDITAQTFFHTEMITREGPGLAEAALNRLDVRVKDWRATMENNQIRLKARSKGYSLDLVLSPLKPPVPHGDNGFSIKAGSGSQASHYYSFTRLQASGELSIGEKVFPVTGLAWMDHEFGSGIVLPDQSGWDWFSVQMDDHTELMVFNMRKRDQTKEKYFGTYVKADGSSMDLKNMTITIDALQKWQSPRTKAIYPSGWIISVKELGLDLEVQPLLKDQELVSEGATGIVYWEGAVRVEGRKKGARIRGQGYVELTGYAHPMAGRL